MLDYDLSTFGDAWYICLDCSIDILKMSQLGGFFYLICNPSSMLKNIKH